MFARSLRKSMLSSKISNTSSYKINISLSEACRNINNTKHLLTRFEGIVSSVRPEKNFQPWNTMHVFFRWIRVIHVSSYADIFTLWQYQMSWKYKARRVLHEVSKIWKKYVQKNPRKCYKEKIQLFKLKQDFIV